MPPTPSPSVVTFRRARWGYVVCVDKKPVLRVPTREEAAQAAVMMREALAEGI